MVLANHAQFAVKRPGFLATRKGARIVRLSAQVLWLPKAGPNADAVIVAQEDWSAIHERCPGLHAFEEMPRARRRDVLAAWLMGAPAPVREKGEDGLLALLGESLVTADGLEKADAIAAVESLFRGATKRPDEPVAGTIAPAGPDDSIRTLYLDTRPTADWPALALIRPRAPLSAERRRDISTLDISRVDISGPRSAARCGGGGGRRTGEESVWTFAFAPGLVFRAETVPEEAEEAGVTGVGGRQLTFFFL